MQDYAEFALNRKLFKNAGYRSMSRARKAALGSRAVIGPRSKRNILMRETWNIDQNVYVGTRWLFAGALFFDKINSN